MSVRKIVSGRRGGLLTLLALMAAAIGAILIMVAVSAQQSAPAPPRSAGSIDASNHPSPSRSSTPIPGGSPKSVTPPLGASRPVSIQIPSIKVQSSVLPIGLAKDGTLAVPQPGPNLDKAAWFKNSPTPGQPGPAIIEGHVDSEEGPSVFFKLGSLRPGDKIHVTRADGVETVFTVNAVRGYKKSNFPTSVVYGSKNLSQPQLRLITCSDFDSSTGHHVGNTVVFAHLTSTHS